MSTNWKWLSDQSYHFKGHVVSEDLANDLELDLYSRGPEAIFVKSDLKNGKVDIDLPGMMWTGRSYRTVEVDGLKIEIPNQDWAMILHYFERYKGQIRAFNETSQAPYVKLHNYRLCIVLSPAQYETLIKGMQEQQEMADKDAEYDNKRFLEGIRAVNEKSQATGGAQIVSGRALALEAAERAKKNGGSN